VNAWYGTTCIEIMGSFFFTRKTIYSNVYLDMLDIYSSPQLEVPIPSSYN
jgi:hypothetical protein